MVDPVSRTTRQTRPKLSLCNSRLRIAAEKGKTPAYEATISNEFRSKK
jgi:hypothetical protein